MSKRVQGYRSWRVRLFLAVVGVTLGIALWYAYEYYQSQSPRPDNLPTAEEWERIRAVEKSGSQIAPNATPGVGVVPPGSKPPEPIRNESVSSTTLIMSTTTTDANEIPASETEPDMNLTDTSL